MTAIEPKCVRLKRDGARRLMRELQGKTVAEELHFWEERTRMLEKRLGGKCGAQVDALAGK